MNIETLNIVKTWFSKLENWQKDLFNNLWQGKDLQEAQDRAWKLILKELKMGDSSFVSNTTFPTDIENDTTYNSSTILEEISDVQGVAALKPKIPLKFNDGLNIIYAGNGCGKSSYVKILKKAEKPMSNIKISSNVFESEAKTKKAKIIFNEGGERKIINWNANSKISCPIRIYDTQIAQQFVEHSTETVYEPKLLNIFTLLATVYDNLYQKLEEFLDDKKKETPEVPIELKNTKLYQLFSSQKSNESIDRFSKTNKFSENDEKELTLLEENSSLKDPTLKKHQLDKQIDLLDKLKADYITASSYLSEDGIASYLSCKNAQIKTKNDFDVFLNSARKNNKFQNFASDEWKKMWKSSTDFIETLDDSEKKYCALCQQELSPEAKKQLIALNDIYLSDLKEKSEYALDQYNKKTEELSKLINQILDPQTILTNLTTNLFEPSLIDLTQANFSKLSVTANKLYYSNDSEIQPIENPENFIVALDNQLNSMKKQLTSITDYIENSEEQNLKKSELMCKKWFSENFKIFDLTKITITLEKYKSKLKTNSITKTKNNLSQKLITDVYIERFNQELNKLCCYEPIKVELQADGKKGKTAHKVSIKGAKITAKPNEILEGEYRIVSLAAFLADLSSFNRSQAFIFDDPITSLDHNYEDKVARSLVELSFQRQVIIFTHRLAFADALISINKTIFKERREKEKLNFIELLNKPLGNPKEKVKYNSKDFVGFLKNINNSTIPQLIDQEKNGEDEIFKFTMQGICSELRNHIESSIETTLLSGIVTRYSKNISTMQINKLKAIRPKDIELIDKMMTKYSHYDHSQPIEKPISLPSIEELKEDVNELLSWAEDFKKQLSIYN